MNINKIIIIVSAIIVIISLIVIFNDEKSKKNVTIITNVEKFEEKILIVLCYADWCSQCKALKPIFSNLVKTQPIDDVYFAMVEESDKTSYEYLTKDIVSYPTVLIDDGTTISTFVGKHKIKDVLVRFNILS